MPDTEAEDPGVAGVSLADLARERGVELEPQNAYAAPEGPVMPPSVARFLMPHERRVIATRPHPARLAGPAAAFGVGLAAAIALNGWAYSAGHATITVIRPLWLAWAAAAAWSAWQWLTWRSDWFVLSGSRALHVWGLARRHVDELPISKMRDVKFTQTMPGRVLNYATFEFASIATDHSLRVVRFMPDPVEIHREISLIISPPGGPLGPKLGRTARNTTDQDPIPGED
jgi:hypothetical protein